MSRKLVVSALYIFIMFSSTFAQKLSFDSLKVKKTVKVNTVLAFGHENNIFKSTDRYYDRTLAEYLPKDTLIKSDRFSDINLNADYSMIIEKSIIDLSLDNWYRRYLNYDDLNQLKSRFKALYGYNINKTTFSGIQYSGTYSDKIAVSTTGEELARSFKYFENSGLVFIEHDLNKNGQIALEYAITHKKYLQEQLAYSLTNTEKELNLDYRIQLKSNHIFYASFSHANRKYLKYRAYNKDGKILNQNPLRNFSYTGIGCKFRYYFSKSLTVIPDIKYTKRKDKFEDYYSYKKIAIGSSVKYTYKKLKASFGIDYKRIKYNIKQAPSLTNSNQLKYNYINTSLNVSYLLNKKVNAFVNFESTSRDSNTELEYYRTLRAYSGYEILLGVKYKFK